MGLIHDVCTAADDPPPFVALREIRLKCENGVEYSGLRADKHRARYPELSTTVFMQAPAVVFSVALDIARTLNWKIAAAVESDGRIEATAATRFLRFKDDVVIRIRAQGAGAQLDVRSASRIGVTDLGVNARRISAFCQELNNRLKTIS